MKGEGEENEEQTHPAIRDWMELCDRTIPALDRLIKIVSEAPTRSKGTGETGGGEEMSEEKDDGRTPPPRGIGSSGAWQASSTRASPTSSSRPTRQWRNRPMDSELMEGTPMTDGPSFARLSHKAKPLMAALALIGAIVAANLALERWGVVTVPIFGMTATAGVYFAGATFWIRDALHETGGRRWVYPTIVVGAVVSWWLSDGAQIPGGITSIAVASGAAFLFSETADTLVYAPLRDRSRTLAVAASQPVGAAVDTALFLWLAFGDLGTFTGQFAVKTMMVAPVAAAVWLWGRR